MTPSPIRRGLSAVEVIVVAIILAAFVLMLMVSLPRQRETARRASCERNLMQIGVALALYDDATSHLPVVAAPVEDPSRCGAGPLRTLLEYLGTSDFLAIADPRHAPAKPDDFQVSERPVRGFICPSDSNATSGLVAAPISYRACTGDLPDGSGGAFAFGRQISRSQVQDGDGTGYTAAFCERLLGDRQSSAFVGNYARVAPPLPATGCPAGGLPRLGDAGASWWLGNWQSTLYSHATPPNAPLNCRTTDGREAFMGASSAHVGGVNLLMLDGSVKHFAPGVDPAIWREFSTTHSRVLENGSGR